MNKIIQSALCLIACLPVIGCLNNRYIAPVTTFRDSTNQTVSVLGDFYSSRNSYEIDLYLSNVASDSKAEVATRNADGTFTPLGRPLFSPQAIKARLDALSLVGTYGSRLYDLANTSAPSDFETAASVLGTNISSLSETFAKLTNTGDPTAHKYVDLISTLVGTIGNMYLQHKRDQLLHEAIINGAPKVDAILGLVANDMDTIFSLEVITGASQELNQAISDYNNGHAKMTYDERVAQLKKIKAAADIASSSTSSAPRALVEAMQQANKSLLDTASASQKDKQITLATLNQALANWTAQIQALSSKIQPLIK